MARRLTGDTATYWNSAWSGVIIRVHDSESVLVQTFRPSGEETIYSKPVIKEVFHDGDGQETFTLDGEHYHLADFMRDNYMEQVI